MKCQYCAEEIQEAAILCRFCGAVKGGTTWHSPHVRAARDAEVAPPAHKGHFTMKSTGAFFLVSAAFELVSIASAVPLLGALREGFVAALYHLAYVGVFAAMGIALLKPHPLGLRVILGGTAFYTLERVVSAFDSGAKKAELAHALVGHEEVSALLPVDAILGIATLTTLLIVAAWWGFALYAYVRRDYFLAAPRPTEGSPRTG